MARSSTSAGTLVTWWDRLTQAERRRWEELTSAAQYALPNTGIPDDVDFPTLVSTVMRVAEAKGFVRSAHLDDGTTGFQVTPAGNDVVPFLVPLAQSKVVGWPYAVRAIDRKAAVEDRDAYFTALDEGTAPPPASRDTLAPELARLIWERVQAFESLRRVGTHSIVSIGHPDGTVAGLAWVPSEVREMPRGLASDGVTEIRFPGQKLGFYVPIFTLIGSIARVAADCGLLVLEPVEDGTAVLPVPGEEDVHQILATFQTGAERGDGGGLLQLIERLDRLTAVLVQ